MMDVPTLPVLLAAPITDERPWVVFGACRDADPEIVFAPDKDDTTKALAICASCPVQVECLDYALEARERFGIWGGTTDKQRRRHLRRTA
jgi:WhiB family redox-sensing transcriptional regulator